MVCAGPDLHGPPAWIPPCVFFRHLHPILHPFSPASLVCRLDVCRISVRLWTAMGGPAAACCRFPNNFQHRQTFVPSFLFVSASERPPIQGSSQAEVNLRFHPFFLGLDSFPGHFPTLLWGSATMTVRSKPAPNNPHFLGRNFKMFLAPLDARGDIVTLFAFFLKKSRHFGGGDQEIPLVTAPGRENVG